MLRIIIPAQEVYDEKFGTFCNIKETELQLEHSLISVSKWEQIWNVPFFSEKEKTNDEILSYIKCMSINNQIDDHVFLLLSTEDFKKINSYIEAKMTATWFGKENRGSVSRQVITSEIIYYWMITLGIPFECQKWHINRLLTLIKICNIKNAPSEKISRSEQINNQRMLNNARRRALRTRG
ncbi:MAG: hypothetical protein SPI49_03335 [Eubacteriales bacterium]|nr:hypothetical protein [Eubacteriales bacterium]